MLVDDPRFGFAGGIGGDLAHPLLPLDRAQLSLLLLIEHMALRFQPLDGTPRFRIGVGLLLRVEALVGLADLALVFEILDVLRFRRQLYAGRVPCLVLLGDHLFDDLDALAQQVLDLRLVVAGVGDLVVERL